MIFFRKKNNNATNPKSWKLDVFTNNGVENNFADTIVNISDNAQYTFALIAEPFIQNQHCYNSAQTIAELFSSILPQFNSFASPWEFLQRTTYVGSTMLMNLQTLNPNYDSRCKIAGMLNTQNQCFLFCVGDAAFYIFDQAFQPIPIAKNNPKFVEKFQNTPNQWHLSSTIINMPLDIIAIPPLKDNQIIIIVNNQLDQHINLQNTQKIVELIDKTHNIAEIIANTFTPNPQNNASIIVYR